jgi:pyruvate-ferredoxin/flavodoxin oxidoreductase
VANDTIRTHSELNYVDFVPLNDVNAFLYGNPLAGLQPGGTIFVQTPKTTPEEVWANVPPKAKAQIREKNVRVMALDAAKIAREEAPSSDLEVRMQGIVLLGIFLKATPFDEEAGLTDEEVMAGVEKAIRKYFGKRGEAVVQANLRAIQRGHDEVFILPADCLASDVTNPVLDPSVEIELFV